MQKLRKKAGLVSTDAVDVYVGVADASASSSFEPLLAGVLEAQVGGGEEVMLVACVFIVGMVALTWLQSVFVGFMELYQNQIGQTRHCFVLKGTDACQASFSIK